MDAVLLIDFGSTFTKVTAVDCETAKVVGRAQSPTTIKSDVALGLNSALDRLVEITGLPGLRGARRLASSSAAGGLRLVVSGLVPRLTSEAARRAALGAGAKVIGSYSYVLSRSDVEQIVALAPDIFLLAGGTDGGDSGVVLRNAEALARSGLTCPFVVAANRSAVDEVAAILMATGKDVRVTANVMPEFGKLDVDPAREAIREVFIARIVRAKGLDDVQKGFDRPVMPTPMAVLFGAEILAKGHGSEPGMGDLLLVDVGGATTDVDSVARGDPTQPSLVQRGLPEPFAKRTVEGDLGIRFNATNILATAGESFRQLVGACEPIDSGLEAHVSALTERVETLPSDEAASRIDMALARTAVDVAVGRHAGVVERIFMSDGEVTIQRGKDLRGVGVVIGTGGIVAYGTDPRYVLEGARYTKLDPLSLRPLSPALFADSQYVFYATGLLAETAPDVAIRLQRQSLVPV